MVKRSYQAIPHSVQTGGSSNVITQWRYPLHEDVLWISHEHRKNKSGVYTEGGPFFKSSRHLTLSEPCQLDWTYNGVRWRSAPYLGWFDASPNPGFSSANLNVMWSDEQAALRPLGTTGWKRSRPGNPTAGISNFLLELRSLPRVPFGAIGPISTLPLRLYQNLRSFRNLGSEYLNVNFGWIPFVKDVRDMYETYRTIDRKLAQIVRDNGKGVHRKRVIRDSTTVTQPQNTYGFTPFSGWQGDVPPNWMSGTGTVLRTETLIEKVWFVGKFRYYIPDTGSSEWTARATRALYGASVTPEVLWNALPWSWLFDYFANVGDILSNASDNAVDNLVADYAYVMRTLTYRHDITGQASWVALQSIPAGRVERTFSWETETKSRISATPYGFGVDFGGLSPYQLSILAALGISRAKFT